MTSVPLPKLRLGTSFLIGTSDLYVSVPFGIMARLCGVRQKAPYRVSAGQSSYPLPKTGSTVRASGVGLLRSTHAGSFCFSRDSPEHTVAGIAPINPNRRTLTLGIAVTVPWSNSPPAGALN